MTITNIKASEVKPGDKIKFPNSRHAQVIETCEVQGDNINLVSEGGEAKWLVPNDWNVKREDEEPNED